jgi:hypothetical protein
MGGSKVNLTIVSECNVLCLVRFLGWQMSRWRLGNFLPPRASVGVCSVVAFRPRDLEKVAIAKFRGTNVIRKLRAAINLKTALYSGVVL